MSFRAFVRRLTFHVCVDGLDRLFDSLHIHAHYWIGSRLWERLYPDWMFWDDPKEIQ